MNSMHNTQEGATLITAIVFLVLITILSVNSMRNTSLNLMMASNEQFRIEAGERVQAILDHIAADPNNLPVTGAVGSIIPQGNIVIPAEATKTVTGETIAYEVIREGPESAPAPPLNEEFAYSAAAYQMAFFEVQATYDGTNVRLGTASQGQGVMVLIPSGQQ